MAPTDVGGSPGGHAGLAGRHAYYPPFDILQLQLGSVVTLSRNHIIEIIWADAHQPPEVPSKRWYWERCMVDDCVVSARSKVDYL